MKLGRRSILLSGFLLMAAGIPAEEPMVPAADQVPLYLRALTYDRSISPEGRAWIKIGIAYDPTSDESHTCYQNIRASLSRHAEMTINGIPYAYQALPLTTEERLVQMIAAEGIDVLYVACECQTHMATLRKVARTMAVLTLAAVGDDVLEGLSIGTVYEDSRLRILVNLPALEAEGRDFSASFLRVCKIIR